MVKACGYCHLTPTRWIRPWVDVTKTVRMHFLCWLKWRHETREP